jgi:Domain of unknown function (DUF4287)
MSFQAYLNNIQAKTGLDPAGFQAVADAKGYSENGSIKPDVKAGTIVAWLKADYGLGHGHAMAIYALLKGKKSEGDAS